MLDYHYQTFLTVCETLNYTRAAELMNLSQPAVSNHIAYLEKELKVKLFSHQNKKVKLTEEGRFLYDKTLFLTNYANKTLGELDMMNYPKINLGSTLSISDYLMPAFLLDMFQEERPFRLNIEVNNTEILLNHLVQGKIDGAFIEGDFNQEMFSSIPFAHSKLVGVCGPDFSLTAEAVTMEELFSVPLLTREKGSGTRLAFESALRDQQITLNSFNNQITLGSINLIKLMAAQGLGIAFLFEICVQEELATGKLKQLPMPDFFGEKQFNFIYLADNPTTEFILTMKEKFT